MADTFETVLQSVTPGNEVTPTPETPPTTGNEGTPTPTPVADEDYPQSVRDYITQNPDHKEIAENLNRQFKAAFTPRLQDAAKLREQYDGLNPDVVGAVRHLQQLITTDPRNAAEYLRQQAQLLEGTQAPTATPETPEFATDVEELLYNRLNELEQWKQQQMQGFEQQRLMAKRDQVVNEFNALEQQFGVQTTLEQRAAAWELSEATQGKMTVSDAFFALNRTTLLPNLIQKAKDEASGVVQQKLGGTAPGSIATRGGPAPNTGPKDFASIFKELNSG
jgi:hypothetical protein